MNSLFSVLFGIFIAINSASSFADVSGKLSIMTYNVENLFDTSHDQGKKDWTYLPRSVKDNSSEIQAYCNSLNNPYYKEACLKLNWSNKVLKTKIKNLSRVISLYNRGRGADIVVFQEVENIIALKMLVKLGLNKLGYKYITLVEGPDSRGIDVGMISRYPIRKQKNHILDLAPWSGRSTRGILEVEFEVGHKTVTVFGNHWPSQGNDDETRVIASAKLADKALRSTSDVVIAVGDFNTVSDDRLNGIKLNILPYFEDVEVKARLQGKVVAKGTHWHRGTWESLDRIFILKSSLKSRRAKVNYKKFDILYRKFMLIDQEWMNRETNENEISINIPNRFDAVTGKGYSDHLPVAVEIIL